MITQAEVSKTAHKEQVSERIIEKDYVITWLLLSLADSVLKDSLVFKGGTALKKIYLPGYRFSEDLDFTLLEGVRAETILQEFQLLLDSLEKAQAFTFNLPEEKIERRTDSLTFYVEFVGPLLANLGSRDIKVDFTLKEKLLFPIEGKPIMSPYSDSGDIQKSLKSYSLEEILTEKLCALIGRTEPRDLYDAHFLLELRDIDYEAVSNAFPGKARSKKIDPRRLAKILSEKEAVFSRMWETRLKPQVKDLPEIKGIMRETNRYFRRYKIV